MIRIIRDHKKPKSNIKMALPQWKAGRNLRDVVLGRVSGREYRNLWREVDTGVAIGV